MTVSPRRARNTDSTAGPTADDSEAIHRIREILFGEQHKDFEARLRDLEDKIEIAITGLRAEFRGQFQELETRTGAVIREVQEALGSLGETQRSDLVQLAERLSAEIRGQQETAAASLAETSGQLRDALVDRSALSSLLAEMARRLGGNAGRPDGGGGDA